MGARADPPPPPLPRPRPRDMVVDLWTEVGSLGVAFVLDAEMVFGRG